MKNFLFYICFILALVLMTGLFFRACEIEQSYNYNHPYSMYGSEN